MSEKKGQRDAKKLHHISTANVSTAAVVACYQILSGTKIISEQSKTVVRDVHHGFAWLVLTDDKAPCEALVKHRALEIVDVFFTRRLREKVPRSSHGHKSS